MVFSLDLLLEAVIFGVLLGCFYAAVSLGLSVAFGLLDIPHVAHPALLVLGAYCTYLLGTAGIDMVNAWATANHLVLSQVKVNGPIERDHRDPQAPASAGNCGLYCDHRCPGLPNRDCPGDCRAGR